MSCICQQCKKDYRIDLEIPDRIWEKIKPAGKAVGAGLLCGPCIMNKLEASVLALGKYGAINAGEDVGCCRQRIKKRYNSVFDISI